MFFPSGHGKRIACGSVVDRLNYFISILAFFLLVWRFGNPLDDYIWAQSTRLRLRFSAKPHPLALTIASIQRIQGYLRSGQSLQTALEEICADASNLSPCVKSARAALAGAPDNSPLAPILQAGLQQGTPVIDALGGMKRAFASQLRAEKKAKALTTQARLQSWIAGALPWTLCLALFSIEPSLLFGPDRTALSCVLLSIAAGLDAMGILWMRRIFRVAFLANDPLARETEQHLPLFLTSVTGKLAIGIDTATAFTDSMPTKSVAPLLLAALQVEDPAAWRDFPHSLRQVLGTRDRALKFGAPIRADLAEILVELESEREARWEEAAQALPIRMLLPLFACIFPANLGVLAIPVLPSLLAF